MSKGPAFPGLARKKAETRKTAAVERAPDEPLPSGSPPSREGKKAITGWFTPAMSRALKQAAFNNEMTMQAVMREAFNDWLKKVGEKPVLD